LPGTEPALWSPESSARCLQELCDNGRVQVVARVRRNHALEHATLAVMVGRGVKGLLAGYSTSGGFWLLAPASGSEVKEAAQQALDRLSAGESRLAISPSCGTNLAVAALLATGAMRVVGARRGKKRMGWQVNAAVALGAWAVSRPLGEALQRKLTTLSDVKGVRVKNVRTLKLGRFRVHRVHVAQDH